MKITEIAQFLKSEMRRELSAGFAEYWLCVHIEARRQITGSADRSSTSRPQTAIEHIMGPAAR
jgi:hypothetical protein